jgi:hypothetical protein
MSSAFVQTLIGAVAAIIGGLGAAFYQTNRADKVARRIRYDERREGALLELDALASALQSRLDALYRQVERGQTQWQYQEALNVLGELAQHWRGKLSGVIPDQEIVNAYNAVDVASQRLPQGGEYVPFMSNLQANDPDTLQRFKNDLGYVLEKLGELRNHVHEQVEKLLPGEPLWRIVLSRPHSANYRRR